jgi:RNA polymerase sigma-70 factor, ECF subfamily
MRYFWLRDLPDEDLVRELRRGADEALTVLFERHYRQLFNLARRVLRDIGEAEDLIQEVYLQIYRDADKFDPSRGGVRNWMLHYTYRRSLNRLKYLKIRGHYDEHSAAGPAAGRHARSTADRDWSIRESLGRLSRNERQVIEDVCFEGLLLREIAERDGESLSNIRNYYYRGIRKLRMILEIDPAPSGGNLEAPMLVGSISGPGEADGSRRSRPVARE